MGGTGAGEHSMVSSWLRHWRPRHDPVLSGDRHSLAGSGDHDAGNHQWAADIDRLGNGDPVASDAVASRAENRCWHVADLDDRDGVSDEHHGCGVDRRRDADLVGGEKKKIIKRRKKKLGKKKT